MGSYKRMKHLAPDYIYTTQGLQANKIVSISDDGRISSITDVGAQSIAPADISTLNGMALLPGFVNAHSHVFQRALRGHTHRPLSKRDTFWTWRRAMRSEEHTSELQSPAMISYAVFCLKKKSGYTSVGEFHYIHHQPGGQPYANPNVMSEAILQAGLDAGIRVVLLMTAYAQGGFNMLLVKGDRKSTRLNSSHRL